jgi:RNA polymerase sigma-54 factor
VKEIIKEIIACEEGPRLTDMRIMEILAKRGINIARRTVSKYRNELDIDSSFQRE